MAGGQEIFIIGKNFVKDSKLVWKGNRWLKVVEPNKEFLHSVSWPRGEEGGCLPKVINLTNQIN